MQTLWDSSQQVIRIALYLVAGGLVRQGWLDEETSVALVGALLALMNVLWTWWWNRQVVTIPALDKAGATYAASVVEQVVASAKK